MQLKMSMRLATRTGSMPYSSPICLAMGPETTMATVLLAQAMSSSNVSKPQPSSPPRLPVKCRLMNARIDAKPPYSRMSALIDATRIVTIIVSNIPAVPVPMAENALAKSSDPVAPPTMANSTMPPPSTRKTLMPHNAAMSTTKYGIACQMLYSKSSSAGVPAMIAIAMRMPSVMSAAGKAMRKLLRNLSFMLTPCVRVAAIVVSEMNERLSPNIAPPTTVPTHNGRLKPALAATVTAMGVSTVMVPTLVPMASEMMQAMTKRPGMAAWAGSMSSSRFAVLSAPPAALAMPENAPAIRKMKSMMTMLSSPMPRAHTWIFSSKDSERFCRNATTSAMTKATTTLTT